MSKKYNLSSNITETIITKKETMKIDDLFMCWGIDLNKEKSGRLYPNFRTLLVSGRAGCTLPNIQQVERNQDIRNIFIAKEGHLLITSDYCYIEMASESQIYMNRYGHSKIAELLNKGVDIHYYTGMLFRFPDRRPEILKILEDESILNISLNKENYKECYSVLEEKFSIKFSKQIGGADGSKDVLTEIFSKQLGITKKEVKDIRQAAKPINFGVPGGMKPNKIRYIALTEYGIALTEEEAENAYKFFLNIYPEVKKWLKDSENYSRVEEDPFFKRKYLSGCVTSTGRLRRIQESNEGHNEWHNTQFQGLTADAVKIAVYRLNKHPEMKVVNMIHDEIVAEVKAEEAKRLAIIKKKIMVETMEKFTPDIRIDVTQEIGRCWRK
jgi:DNA polymerase I-like protein with 3'-5' exonuclease and polymerase domains